MSMISELIKDLKRVKRHIDPLEKDKFVCSTVESMKIIDTAIDTIEALSAKLAKANMERSERYYGGGWISCKDRLPEDYQRVIVCVNRKVFEDTLTFVLSCKENIIGYFLNAEQDLKIEVREKNERNSISWQPLPQPYQGE